MFRTLLIALATYTRLPLPPIRDWKPEDANRSLKGFTFVGIVVGCIAACTYILSNYLFGPMLGVVLSVASSALVTGCFHEDGFADMLDGFGGGATQEKILEIMKDSRNGTFGTIGLIFLILVKIAGLYVILPERSSVESAMMVLLVMLIINTLPRAVSASVVYVLPYVRKDGSGKLNFLPRTQNNGWIPLWIVGILPLAFTTALEPRCLLILPVLALVALAFGTYIKKRIGGYTGDCLGALEQICELAVILTILIILRF